MTDSCYESLYAEEERRLLAIIREAGQFAPDQDEDMIQREALRRLTDASAVTAYCDGLTTTYRIKDAPDDPAERRRPWSLKH